MKNSRTKTHNLYKILFLLIVFLGVGYAFLEANLNINGDVTVTQPEFNTYVQSVSKTTGSTSGTPTIIGADKKEVDFTTSLTNDVNSFFEETTIVINKGSKKSYFVDIDIKVFDSSGNEVTLSAPYEYTLIDGEGKNVQLGHRLIVNSTDEYKFRFKYINGTDMSTVTDYPEYTFKIIYNYTKESFEDDSWDVIKTKINSNISNYPIGATKTIELDLDDDNIMSEYELRVVNNTNPTECTGNSYSQGTCGFVVEFDEIVSLHLFNPFVPGTSVNGNGTKGGWEYSDIRNYLNDDNSSSSFYSHLPSDLKDVIKDTVIITGHGNEDASNFVTTDKVYLLNPMEVYNSNPGNYDTAALYTRQLDYYRRMKTSITNYGPAIKKYNGENSGWWLVSPMYTSNSIVQLVGVGGNLGNNYSSSDNGVSPVFRVG